MVNPDFFTGRLGNRLFQTAFLYAQIKKGAIPDWYLQDPKYFEGYEDDIKKLFSEGIGYLSQVGVHVRRGSNPINPAEPKYSENSFYVNLGETDYYDRAMALFPNENFLIFSDDPEWCKEKFQGNNIQVMDMGNDIIDFNLLASCKHIIMANSSFSWWAAYLCPNLSKKIIAPAKWYADGIQRTVLPKEWLQIDFRKLKPRKELEILTQYKIDQS